ncbi:uridylate kinase [Mesomycoplasma conjunctivae]|uniref:Uridylate kinase n=1 Tax=Mesomycoplasma conjunctivae (strain ATCC 25834 / NCTC 10147 / HRC/581) TaxID=572263 RepID=C5J7A8_MESCH|nr:UMP kinase [Mesomycoplasma conjunctivae]CAT05371.1 Uridylate kinase [Mesomycoplasma conjunctivae]VEU66597.1 uridylate kinase [Mesomycoplasma conjunctivae]
MNNTILIKLSGESLANKSKSLSIDNELVRKIGIQLKEVQKLGYKILIVIGGGNFWRGASAEKNGIKRNKADYIGMLATIMNGLALESAFKELGINSRVLSSINIDPRVCEYYINEKAVKYLENDNVIIFVGGTGRPYFTTDSATTLFASEMGANLILVGKNSVNGVFDSDPRTNPNAVRYDTITYSEVIEKDLKVMDSTAFSMARDNKLELIIFDIKEENSIINVIKGKIKHTKVF